MPGPRASVPQKQSREEKGSMWTEERDAVPGQDSDNIRRVPRRHHSPGSGGGRRYSSQLLQSAVVIRASERPEPGGMAVEASPSPTEAEFWRITVVKPQGHSRCHPLSWDVIGGEDIQLRCHLHILDHCTGTVWHAGSGGKTSMEQRPPVWTEEVRLPYDDKYPFHLAATPQ